MHICDRSLAKASCGRDDGVVDLDPAHLRSFVAIVDYGGYHRAAEALHLTQPAVSRHMRRLEAQLGEPLFARRGRGVELTPYGERAAQELRDVLAAHDRALARLGRGADSDPFVLGTIENLVDPVLPELIAATRAELGERALALRVDRSAQLVERLRRVDVDAALVLDPGDASDAVAAESPHLSGVQSAVRNGLGYALLAAGGDGLRAVGRGPLAETIPAPLWLLLDPAHRRLVAPLRAALWRATMRRGLPEAA